MAKQQYEHIFIQHVTAQGQDDTIPMDVAAGLNAWGADGWEVVNMEAVWVWQREADGACWPEQLRGYYVTFKRDLDGWRRETLAVAEVALPLESELD